MELGRKWERAGKESKSEKSMTGSSVSQSSALVFFLLFTLYFHTRIQPECWVESRWSSLRCLIYTTRAYLCECVCCFVILNSFTHHRYTGPRYTHSLVCSYTYIHTYLHLLSSKWNYWNNDMKLIVWWLGMMCSALSTSSLIHPLTFFETLSSPLNFFNIGMIYQEKQITFCKQKYDK